MSITRVFRFPLTGTTPPGWKLIEIRCDGGSWVNLTLTSSIIASVAEEQDGRWWLHLSIANRHQMPSYEDITFLKKHWAGDDKKCIMIFPAKDEHINIHPNCIHLFCCLDDDPLPDFTRGAGSLQTTTKEKGGAHARSEMGNVRSYRPFRS